MKGKSKGVCSLSTKLGFPAIFLSCSLFFLAGFYASVLLSHVRFLSYHRHRHHLILVAVSEFLRFEFHFQDVSGGDGVAHRPMLLEVAEEEGEKHEVMLNGETGESFVAGIPSQVLEIGIPF